MADERAVEIKRIAKDESLTLVERTRMIQELMQRKFLDSQESKDDIVQTTSEQHEKSYFPHTTILGCKHYKRNCKLKQDCCGKIFVCRLCHDEQTDHQCDRYLVETMLCMLCNTEQPQSNKCCNAECGQEMARYYCGICKFFDGEPNRDIYHCPHCGLCRRGKGLGIDFQHCMKCNMCFSMAINDHKCIENNLCSDCPVCHRFMFTSTIPVMFMPCGHPIHPECLRQWINNDHTSCPVCSKTCIALESAREHNRNIDLFLQTQSMPVEFASSVATVLCNDCLLQSRAAFHFAYHKCGNSKCGSYNTTLVSREEMQGGYASLGLNVVYDHEVEYLQRIQAREAARNAGEEQAENAEQENEEKNEEDADDLDNDHETDYEDSEDQVAMGMAVAEDDGDDVDGDDDVDLPQEE